MLTVAASSAKEKAPQACGASIREGSNVHDGSKKVARLISAAVVMVSRACFDTTP